MGATITLKWILHTLRLYDTSQTMKIKTKCERTRVVYRVQVQLNYLPCMHVIMNNTQSHVAARRWIDGRWTMEWNTGIGILVTTTADRDSSRYGYSGIRRTRQLAQGCESN